MISGALHRIHVLSVIGIRLIKPQLRAIEAYEQRIASVDYWPTKATAAD